MQTYTWVVGTGLTALGVAGMFGILDAGYGRSILYLATAAIFFYVSFGRREAGEIRGVVGGIGALYLLSGAFVVGALYMLELPLTEGHDLEYSLAHIAFGALSIFFARISPCEQ